jgi:formylmethanofuran dehydrogenase subunit E
MSILGARLGLAVRDALEKPRGSGGRLHARFHHRTCALDGIQLSTQCTVGNGNLEVVEAGEHRLVLTAAGDTRQIEGRLTLAALELGRRYADLRTRADQLSPGEADEPAIRKQMGELLAALETAPQEEIVSLTVGSL